MKYYVHGRPVRESTETDNWTDAQRFLERVAMTVTGHKARAVFDRYHIVSPGDLQDVARRLTGQVRGKGGTAAVDGHPASS